MNTDTNKIYSNVSINWCIQFYGNTARTFGFFRSIKICIKHRISIFVWFLKNSSRSFHAHPFSESIYSNSNEVFFSLSDSDLLEFNLCWEDFTTRLDYWIGNCVPKMLVRRCKTNQLGFNNISHVCWGFLPKLLNRTNSITIKRSGQSSRFSDEAY